MKNTFTFLAAAFLGVAAQAQITIVSTDLGSVGDQVTYITDTTSAGSTMAPATGSAQTFNYSTLGVADFDDILFLDPATTPAASFFPNANLAIDVPGNNLVYAIKSTTSMDIDGIFGDILRLRSIIENTRDSGLPWKILDEEYSRVPLAIALPRNDANFRSLVDWTLQDMFLDGTEATFNSYTEALHNIAAHY